MDKLKSLLLDAKKALMEEKKKEAIKAIMAVLYNIECAEEDVEELKKKLKNLLNTDLRDIAVEDMEGG